jgi:hypothetical protein
MSDGGLHIDGDWKAEAAKEKQRLMEEEAQSNDESQPGGGPPAPNFLELINLLAMQAAVGLGGYRGPDGETSPPNPAAAKHFIDLLEVLEVKTKGNLSDEESKTLNAITHEIKMAYVQAVSPQSAPPTPDAGA